MASANGSQPDIEHRNNPEKKGANSEVTGAYEQFDSAYGSSIADSGVTNRSQAIHQQDGPTSIGAITHQAAHAFPSGSGTISSDERGIGAVQADSRVSDPQEFADTPTSPVVREDGPNCEQAKKDVYRSVPENDPDVLAGEGQQPG